MEILCCFKSFLLVFFAAFFITSESSLNKVIPQSYRASGVFYLSEGNHYTLNFTAARDACLSLNVRIATKAQIAQALHYGLEICKYGWVAEQIAVIPRLSPEKKCGQSKTGVVEWLAKANQMFGVFCFNASALTDPETTPKSTPVEPQSFTSSASLTALTRTLTSSTHLVRSTSRSIAKSPQQTALTSTFVPLIKTAQPNTISSSTSPSPRTSFTHVAISLPLLITSETTAVSFTISTSTHAFNFPVSSESMLPQPEGTAKPSLGALYITLITFGIILLLTAAAGTVLYCKFSTRWSQGQPTDDIEAEMWKRTNSEIELQSQYGDDGDKEESDRKYSSNITLCVKQDIKANSWE